MNIIKNQLVFNDYLVIHKSYILNKNNKIYTRLTVKRDKGVGVLLYNQNTENFIFVQQNRFPIYSLTNKPITEIVAGIIDKNETSENAAIRESIEESGYKIKPDNLYYINEYFVSPGLTDDRIDLYIAFVTNDDKIADGGGLETENEEISIIEISKDKINEYNFNDAKTILSLMYFNLNYFKIFK